LDVVIITRSAEGDLAALGDVFILRSTGVDDRAADEVEVVVDEDDDDDDDDDDGEALLLDLGMPVFLVGVEGRKVGLDPVLEDGDGVLPLLDNKLELPCGELLKVDGIEAPPACMPDIVPWLLRTPLLLMLCASLGFDLLNCEGRISWFLSVRLPMR
jgi:hypothetical protein